MRDQPVTRLSRSRKVTTLQFKGKRYISDHDVDGDNNVKTSICFMSKSNTSACVSNVFFGTFFSSLHDYEVKLPGATFYGVCKYAAKIFPSLADLR